MSDENVANLSDRQMRASLAEILRLGDAGIAVERVDMFGEGPRARVAVTLSNGQVLDVERFGDLTSATKLATLITTTTGISAAGIKGPEAYQAVALMRRMADLHEATTQQDIARDFGIDFLRQASRLDVNLADQRERWGAFSRLDAIEPDTLVSQGKAPNIAAASTVLVTPSGNRHVHCGHFAAHVRRAFEHVAPVDLALRMESVGWTRRGTRGRWRARAVGRADTILVPLWDVPPRWDEDADDG